ncbi:MAG: glycoside hydrolase family 27 protein [Victivallales bacterium]
MQKASTRFNEVAYQTKPAPGVPWDKGSPAINGPDIYGASPEKDFLYLIPTVGERPVRFFAENLPAGLIVEKESGRIKGKAEKKGQYLVSLKAENRHGKCAKTLKLVIDDNALALTPPMGWNSWNCYRSDIDNAKIRAIADGMVSSGLAARGYTCVNMDSGWQSKKRGGKFNSIVPHDGFPDMQALCDHIHSLGLKAGIYSSPYTVPLGTDGCGTSSGIRDTNYRGGVGINKHEHEDVCQWAEWGFDYLKYDWSPTDMILMERMSRALRDSPRDIIFSVCTDVHIKDAFKVKELANLWRSNMDMFPTWDSVLKNGFKNNQLMDDGFINNQDWNPVIGFGHWFDLDLTHLMPKFLHSMPDFLPREDKGLSQNERIFHISCWMMRPSPILIDCEPATMDDFVLSLLCNEEIIAVNQDSLGKPAATFFNNDSWKIQIKPLADGNYALAFFNLSGQPAMAPKINLSQFSVPEKFKVRDLWAKEDIGEFEHNFVVGVDSHCAKVFKIFMR